jgi:hypothetical protein
MSAATSSAGRRARVWARKELGCGGPKHRFVLVRGGQVEQQFPRLGLVARSGAAHVGQLAMEAPVLAPVRLAAGTRRAVLQEQPERIVEEAPAVRLSLEQMSEAIP